MYAIRSYYEEGLADVDDGHRKPESPGRLRDRRRVVAGPEDDEIGRRQHDFAEHLCAIDRLDARRRVWRAQPSRRACDSLSYNFV